MSDTAPSIGLGRGFIQTVIGNAAVIGLSVISGALTARLLGVEGRGEYAALTLVPNLLFIISVLGVHEAVTFHVARQEFSTEEVLGAGLLLTIPLAIIGTLAAILLVPVVLSRYPAHIQAASRLYSLSIPVGLLHGVLLRVLQGSGRFGWWNQLRVFTQLNALFSILILWPLGWLTSTSFAMSFLLFNTATLVGIIIIFHQLGLLRVKRRPGVASAVWQYSWRAAIATVPQIYSSRIDQLIVAMLLTTSALGLYSAASSWAVGFLPLVQAYGSVLFPSVASHGRDRGTSAFTQAVRRGTTPLVIGSIAYLLITPLAVRIVYGSDFVPSTPAALLLVLSSVFLGVNQMLGGGLKGLGRPLLVGMAELGGVIGAAALLFLLVGPLGIVGAALATLGAYAFTLVILLAGMKYSGGFSMRELFVLRNEDWQAIVERVRLRLSRARPAA